VRFILTVTALCLIGPAAIGQQPAAPLPDAAASDPNVQGLMRGFPPPPDKTVRFATGAGWQFPMTRWAFSHWRELRPTVNVWRGAGPANRLPRAERKDLDAVRFTTLDGRPMTWGESLAANYTDGIVVLHRGRIVYERYFGALEPPTLHLAFSVTKSVVGALAATLAADGRLTVESPVIAYVPELRDSAFGDATVRHVLDMTTGLKYSEAYADPKADVWDYGRACGSLPVGADYRGPDSCYAYLPTLKKEGEHGVAFAYKTPNAEVAAWIVKRAAGKSLATLLSEMIWQKLGAEQDAYFAVDDIGTEIGGGGLATTLRDLARFGEMIRLNGRFNGQRILPAAAIAEIRRGGDRSQFVKAGYATLPGWSYRDLWWVSHNEHGAFAARGIYGQAIWIDPTAEMVIARYASFPKAANANLDPTSLPAYAALGTYLMQRPAPAARAARSRTPPAH
jgi:CubicO group peptidase (beta-lactamase class C family)